MFNWMDRVYINARKKIFKNLDTGEILNLELQDDPDNIAQDSETPITAHNLNMAQQELVDDMSKTYTGTNITANTIEGIGRINKVYGKTTEEGTGDKSPSNPYTLKCVGDDINLFNATLESGTIGATGINTDNNMRVRTADYITLDKGTYTISYSGANYVGVQQYDTNNNNICTLVSWTAGTATFNVTEKCKVRFIFKINDSTVMTVNSVTKIKLQKGTVATAYSPYGYGTVEDISKNGSNSSSNIVYVDKPLCGIGNVRDELNYKGQIIRRCGYIASYSGENISANYITNTGSLSTGATVVYELATPVVEDINCSNKIVQYDGQTTVYNRDGAEIEVSLTNNNAISEANKNLDIIEQKQGQMSSYSTEEQIVGRWIDGKSIYRKVISGNTPTIDTNGGTWYNIASNVQELVNVYGNIAQRPYNYATILRSGSYVSAFDIVVDSNMLKYRNLGVASNQSYKITLEYTKTTD